VGENAALQRTPLTVANLTQFLKGDTRSDQHRPAWSSGRQLTRLVSASAMMCPDDEPNRHPRFRSPDRRPILRLRRSLPDQSRRRSFSPLRVSAVHGSERRGDRLPSRSPSGCRGDAFCKFLPIAGGCLSNFAQHLKNKIPPLPTRIRPMCVKPGRHQPMPLETTGNAIGERMGTVLNDANGLSPRHG
jgi:hypothetical protein